ncbi:M56 family metallopeptidase [Demetria terragena]|uniref:M56 family metallopeptidase n=1 Tax=Demetria terragena TaxID=63959 RepID=UPI00037E001B|nr:M56 family metallopeptidase [Demetria terragena]
MDPTLGAALLVGLALLFSGPAPRLLPRWRALRAVPGSALMLWQAVSLAALIAGLAAAPVAALHPNAPAVWVLPVALLVSGVLLARLLLAGHRTGIALRRARREHRELVDLIGFPDPGEPTVRVLEHPTPTAYCLPGMRSRVVLSEGALRALTEPELAAVLEHERAHLRFRHDLVLEHFTVMHTAVPEFVRSPGGLREVRLLVELHADRYARARHRARALGSALVALAEGQHPEAGMGATGDGMAGARLNQLRDRASHRTLSLVAVLLGAIALASPITVMALMLP